MEFFIGVMAINMKVFLVMILETEKECNIEAMGINMMVIERTIK